MRMAGSNCVGEVRPAQILFREVDVLALGALLRGECLCEDLSQSLKNNVRNSRMESAARVSRELQDRNLTKQGDAFCGPGPACAHRSAAQRKRVQFGVQCPDRTPGSESVFSARATAALSATGYFAAPPCGTPGLATPASRPGR